MGIKENLQALFEKQKRDMEEYGVTVLGVGGSETGEPPFTYSIGFYRLNHPEIIIFGLSPAISHTLITDIFNRVKGGESFSDGDINRELVVGHAVKFRKVRNDVATSEYATWAAQHSESEGQGIPDVLMMVWPDTEGRFPWNENFDQKFERAQPAIWQEAS